MSCNQPYTEAATKPRTAERGTSGTFWSLSRKTAYRVRQTERISINHNKFITIDFSFRFRYFQYQMMFGVIVRGQLVVGVLGQVLVGAPEMGHTPRSCKIPCRRQHRSSRLGKLDTPSFGTNCRNWAVTWVSKVLNASMVSFPAFQTGLSELVGSGQKYLAVHVTYNGICVVLVDGFQPASRLQNKAGRDFTAADGSLQLFQICPILAHSSIRHRTWIWAVCPPHIICFIAKQIEKLCRPC